MFEIPSKSAVGVLDPEIAGEGERVLLSNGDEVNWSPPPINPVIPDMSQIKSIRHLFGRKGFKIFPAWLYHPDEEPRVVKTEEDAARLGVKYRNATQDERHRYGVQAVWDYAEGCQWRPQPWKAPKFDPARPGSGKTFVRTPFDPASQQSSFVSELIPQVAAAVAKAMQQNGPAAPAAVDPKQWAEFQQFMAWQKSAEAVQSAVQSALDDAEVDEEDPRAENALSNAISAEEEFQLWKEEAEGKGIKVDGRWSLDRLKSEVQKAA